MSNERTKGMKGREESWRKEVRKNWTEVVTETILDLEPEEEKVEG